jgi:predicted dinucleotide-utilizing enzyme
MSVVKKRVGIVGYGAVGRYLTEKLINDPVCQRILELSFVCDPINAQLVFEQSDIPKEACLERLSDFATKQPDLIVEVAHPDVTRDYGMKFLETCDYMPGSPTAFANPQIERGLRSLANNGPHGLYIPSGALWGSRDIQKMADRGTLQGLIVTMRKAPHHLKLSGSVNDVMQKHLAEGFKGRAVLYEGPVRDLCSLAPNNVNTMAAAALAGHNLGFDKTVARLEMDTETQAHEVDIEVFGPGGFTQKVSRHNPAAVGAVTGDATYASFLSSMLEAGGKGSGVHFC